MPVELRLILNRQSKVAHLVYDDGGSVFSKEECNLDQIEDKEAPHLIPGNLPDGYRWCEHCVPIERYDEAGR